MNIFRTIDELRQARGNWQGAVGLVPTMGALHEGHAAIVRKAVAENPHTVVSIFVNPTQFGPNEDFDQYPRDLQADADLLHTLGVKAIFAPDVSTIYPKPPAQITFEIGEMGQVLCAVSRPGHMNGVLQVVSILFNLVEPDRAYFGLKDYQQQLLIQQMVRELHVPVQIVPCPIVRETDGIAMSSRNRYLSPEARTQALALSRILAQIKALRGEWKDADEVKQQVITWLQAYPDVKLDYFEIRDGRDLSLSTELNPDTYPIALIAAFLGTTRLIDNMPLWEYPTV